MSKLSVLKHAFRHRNRPTFSLFIQTLHFFHNIALDIQYVWTFVNGIIERANLQLACHLCSVEK